MEPPRGPARSAPLRQKAARRGASGAGLETPFANHVRAWRIGREEGSLVLPEPSPYQLSDASSSHDRHRVAASRPGTSRCGRQRSYFRACPQPAATNGSRDAVEAHLSARHPDFGITTPSIHVLASVDLRYANKYGSRHGRRREENMRKMCGFSIPGRASKSVRAQAPRRSRATSDRGSASSSRPVRPPPGRKRTGSGRLARW